MASKLTSSLESGIIRTMKCTKCNEVKPDDDFSWKVRDVRRARQCKECHRAYRKEHYLNNRDKYIAKAKKWKSENWMHYYAYRITDEEFLVMLKKFDGKCWCCKEREAKVVDHDHSCCSNANKRTCGKCTRGLLCKSCNSGIGLLGDSVEGLKRATEYLSAASIKVM